MFTEKPTISAHMPHDQVALITLSRAQAANALNTQMGNDLTTTFRELPATCRAVVLTGKGKHFCAGADLKERQGMTQEQWKIQHNALESALHAIIDCNVPVIAAVNGAAFGGGLELALAADFIYATDTARFGLTETTLGIMPGLGGAQTLMRVAGMPRAKEAIFTGLPFNAEQALAWGVVNTIFPCDQLLDNALQTALRIAQNAPLAIRSVKQSLHEGSTLPLKTALNNELSHYNKLINTDDRQEGVSAFNEKRKPCFSGT